MSDFETSPPREIEIDADGEGGEALLNKSLSPEPENIKANGRKSSSDRHKSRSRSRSRTRSGSHSRHRHRKSRKRHSRSRSRSRSPRKHQRSRNSRSRTKSRSRERRSRYEDDYRTPDYRDDSRSPMSSRKRHAGDRENPEPNRCLGVFGLSLYTQERGLRDVFGRYGPIEEVQIVYDRQSGRSRGFGFVYFRSSDDAFEAKEHCNGLEVDGRRIRVDYSITERAHTPTPGIYLGQASERRSSNRKYTSSFRRSPTPDYTYGYRRSRSYSPARLLNREQASSICC